MGITNSYIFLEREQRKKKPNNCGLAFPKSFPGVIKELLANAGYAIGNSSKSGSCVRGTICATADTPAQTIQLRYQQTRAGYLLDISIEGKNQQNIQILAKLDKTIQDSNSELNKKYLIILSYDAVSEHYCNRLYPLLNSFERKLKQLFFNIYIANFGQVYFSKTVDEEVAKKIKKTVSTKSGIKRESEKNELYIKQWFYGFDYQDMYNTIFQRNIASSDRKSVEQFLNNTSDLSRVDDTTLREQFEKCLGRNNWERLGFDNRLCSDFESLLRQIQGFRNNVMHCYFMNEDQYNEFRRLIARATRSVNEAIKVTQKKDFGTQALAQQEELTRNIIAQLEPMQKAIHEWTQLASFAVTQTTIKQLSLASTRSLQYMSDVAQKVIAQALTTEQDDNEGVNHDKE